MKKLVLFFALCFLVGIVIGPEIRNGGPTARKYGDVWRYNRQPYVGKQQGKPICAGLSIEWAYEILYRKPSPLSGHQIWLRSTDGPKKGITMVDGFTSAPELYVDGYGTDEPDLRTIVRMVRTGVPVLIGHAVGNKGHHMAPLIAVSDSGWLVLLNTTQWSSATYYIHIDDVESVWCVAREGSLASHALYCEYQWDWLVSDTGGRGVYATGKTNYHTDE